MERVQRIHRSCRCISSWYAGVHGRLSHEFRKLAVLAGYVYRKGGVGAISAQGYFVMTTSHLYDFQVSRANGIGRGLLVQQHDPLGRRTIIGNDVYGLCRSRLLIPSG